MNEGKYILFFLGSLGAFNALILSVYLMATAHKKYLSNFFLGLMLLMLSVRIGKSVFVFFDPVLPKIYLQIGLSACFLIGPALFLFIRSVLEQPAKIPRSYTIHLLVLFVLIVSVGIAFPYSTYRWLWGDYFSRGIYGVWFLYNLVSIFLLKPVFGRWLYDKNNVKPAEKWLTVIFVSEFIIFLTYAAAFFLGRKVYFSGSIVFSFILYGIILVLLLRKNTASFFSPPGTKYNNRKVNEAEASGTLQKLNAAISSQQLYKNSQLSLGELAKVVNLSSHQLSQLLNDNLGKNFTTFINEYRIEEACKMIAANHPFSLESIGYEVGFNSKSTFYTAFKKVKATTPLAYKERMINSNIA